MKLSSINKSSTEWNYLQRTIIWLAASILMLFALRWLQLFIFTDYRVHHRPFMIPLGIIFIAFSYGLIRYSKFCIFTLLIGASLFFVAATFLQIKIGFVSWFLSSLELFSFTYIFLFAPSLWRFITNKNESNTIG